MYVLYSEPVFMIMEYMCHGDLLGFLRSTRKHTDMYTVYPGTKNLPTHLKLTSRDLLHIIIQIVDGMIFLSEKKVQKFYCVHMCTISYVLVWHISHT